MLNDVHVSLDIEACGEIVLSIGACTFDPRTGEELSPCYVVPSIVDQIRAGLRPDGDALLWLLKQSDGCREAIHMAQTLVAHGTTSTRWSQFYALTKPRVVALMLVTAIVGMLLASPPGALPWHSLFFGTTGIAFAAAAAAVPAGRGRCCTRTWELGRRSVGIGSAQPSGCSALSLLGWWCPVSGSGVVEDLERPEPPFDV